MLRASEGPGTICRRIDDALVFVAGIGIGPDRLGAFLEELRGSLGAPLAWAPSALEVAFRSAFGVPVSVQRYSFDASRPGVAFHIRRAETDREQRPVA